jgi:hypothetical protein
MAKEWFAVICDNISGECILATKENLFEKHMIMRDLVRQHKLPTKNLQGETVEGGYGWTDAETFVITDLSKENLQNALKAGYKIPKELLKLKGLI